MEKDKRKLTTVWGFRLSPPIDKNFSVACSPRATGVSVLSDLRITTKKLLQVWRTLFVVFPQNANFQSPKSYFFFNGLKSTADFARTSMEETIFKHCVLPGFT